MIRSYDIIEKVYSMIWMFLSEKRQKMKVIFRNLRKRIWKL